MTDKFVKLDGKSYRLTPEVWKLVKEHKDLYNIKTDADALASAIKEAYHLRLYLKYFMEHTDATKEEPACLRRIFFEGEFYCAKRAPHIYALPTLDICRACKWQIVAWQKRGPNPLLGAAETPGGDGRATTNTVKEVYCKANTLYVVKSACDMCPEPCDKKALFYPEEGEPAT